MLLARFLKIPCGVLPYHHSESISGSFCEGLGWTCAEEHAAFDAALL